MLDEMINRFKNYQDDYQSKSDAFARDIQKFHQEFISGIQKFIDLGFEKGLVGIQINNISDKEIKIKINDIDWLITLRDDIAYSSESSNIFTNRIYCYMMDDLTSKPFYIIEFFKDGQSFQYKIYLKIEAGLKPILVNNQSGEDIALHLIEQIYLIKVVWNNSPLKDQSKSALGFLK